MIFNNKLVEWYDKLPFFLMWGMLFCIPTSTSTTTFLGGLLILYWIAEGNFQEKWNLLRRNGLFWAWMAYVVIYPISILWTTNWEWTLWLMERHSYMLIFPFVYTLVKKEWIFKLVMAYALGMTVSEVFSYLVWFGVIHMAGVSPHDPTPFVFGHFVYNPLLAWALYILMHAFLFEKRPLAAKIFFSVFIFTMTVNMFITGGRGGQLAYFFVILLLFIQYFSDKGKLLKGITVGSIFVTMVFTFAYHYSPSFNQRVHMGISDLVNYNARSTTSWGTRLHFYINTLKMSSERPISGSGFGDYPDDYNKFVGKGAPVHMGASRIAFFEPHNQFLYELGSLGIVGLSILIWIMVQQFRLAFKLNDSYRHYRLAFSVFMIIMLMPDGLLIYTQGIYFFVLFSAILFRDFGTIGRVNEY